MVGATETMGAIGAGPAAVPLRPLQKIKLSTEKE